MDRDLYEILGLKKDATERDIQKAFRVLAKKYHPDVNQDNKEAENKFKEVNLAHEVLKDPKKRKQYDQAKAMGADPCARRAAGGPGGQNPFGGGAEFADFGLGDLFEEIFGGQTGGVRGRRRGGAGASGGGFRFSQRGTDRETVLPINFLEAARGGDRYFELSDGRKLTVKIPEGVETGSKIKLSGQGDPGIGGAPNGDLILQLEVGPHPVFTREGFNVVTRLPISFAEAVLGAEVEVPTLDGKVHMKIPKGVSSLQRLKLSNKGIRSTKSGTSGDQFVELIIKVPRQPDEKYVEAAEKLKDSTFDPRTN